MRLEMYWIDHLHFVGYSQSQESKKTKELDFDYFNFEFTSKKMYTFCC
jgi:hypothetical protein